MGSQGSLMNVGSESWPYMHQTAEKVDAGPKQSERTRKAWECRVHRSLLCKGLHSHSPCCSPLKTPAMGMWASELDCGAATDDGLVLFYITYLETPGTRMFYGKKARQWGSVMLLYIFFWETLGPAIHVDVIFDKYHIPKFCYRPCTPFNRNGTFWRLWPLSTG